MSSSKLQPPAEWAALLVDAVNKPGLISDAYSRFWNYSVGNQLLALFQCHARKIESGPIHTFAGWSALGRNVRKGKKAITLCMPVKVKARDRLYATGAKIIVGNGAERQPDERSSTHFVYRANWFVLSQTEGKEYVPTKLPDWDEAIALNARQIDRVPFRHADGNTHSYAAQSQVAVSSVGATSSTGSERNPSPRSPRKGYSRPRTAFCTPVVPTGPWHHRLTHQAWLISPSRLCLAFHIPAPRPEHSEEERNYIHCRTGFWYMKRRAINNGPPVGT